MQKLSGNQDIGILLFSGAMGYRIRESYLTLDEIKSTKPKFMIGSVVNASPQLTRKVCFCSYMTKLIIFSTC